MVQYDRYTMRNTIDRYIINPRYREVLLLKFFDGYSHEEVAERANYSVQHVKYIVKTYKEYLFSHL